MKLIRKFYLSGVLSASVRKSLEIGLEEATTNIERTFSLY
jgi:hypothetical protein